MQRASVIRPLIGIWGRLQDASGEILARQTGQSGAPRVITARARPAAPVRRLLARVGRGAHHGKQPWPARLARVLRTCRGQRCRRPRRLRSAGRERILPVTAARARWQARRRD